MPKFLPEIEKLEEEYKDIEGTLQVDYQKMIELRMALLKLTMKYNDFVLWDEKQPNPDMLDIAALVLTIHKLLADLGSVFTVLVCGQGVHVWFLKQLSRPDIPKGKEDGEAIGELLSWAREKGLLVRPNPLPGL